MIDFLIEHVEASADWRAEKAARYADDRRNRRSSDSLTKLAQELRELLLITNMPRLMNRWSSACSRWIRAA